MTGGVALELIAQDAAAVRVAASFGAARVELCQALALGGLTPSIATVEAAVAAARELGGSVGVHVLIRPRGGGFHYTADEVAVMAGDIRAAVAAGADGVVIGCLDASGRLAVDEMRRLRDAAGDAGVAAHRAIDVSADPLEAFDTLIELGLDRVLTSGAAPTAFDGRAMLRDFVDRADGRIAVVAGGGVTATTVPAILETGVRELHFSAKRTVSDRSGVSMGSASEGVGDYEVVDSEVAFAIADAARRAVAEVADPEASVSAATVGGVTR
ncbi:copper homeostasis protein CutC [Agromyces sp. NPDC057679]|uniref:copper homeostasis protein CutC n=1 Tax=Agromyces sp. NPDC057679 TaxID=3346207 RepID=UPI00366FC240